MFQEIATILGIKKSSLLAAFFGALVSMPFIKAPYESLTARALYKCYVLVSGILGAIYVGPAIASTAEYMTMESMIVFLTGVFFMSVASAIHNVVQNTDLNTLMNVLRAWVGRPPKE